jgi:hypothetical protein
VSLFFLWLFLLSLLLFFFLFSRVGCVFLRFVRNCPAPGTAGSRRLILLVFSPDDTFRRQKRILLHWNRKRVRKRMERLVEFLEGMEHEHTTTGLLLLLPGTQLKTV